MISVTAHVAPLVADTDSLFCCRRCGPLLAGSTKLHHLADVSVLAPLCALYILIPTALGVIVDVRQLAWIFSLLLLLLLLFCSPSPSSIPSSS